MGYLCTRQLTAGGVTYHPGEAVPDGVILPNRSGKLIRSGYISKLQEYAAELQETSPGAWEGTVQISVKGTADGENEQITAVPARPEEILQVFSILQMNAEEGAKAIADVTSENVLILLHAADSRKTIKNAAKERASRLMYAVEPQNRTSAEDWTAAENRAAAEPQNRTADTGPEGGG